MPLDVLGRTRATLTHTASITSSVRLLVISNMRRAGDRSLEFLILNEECLVSAGHQPALIKSLPFVHTARRSYRLDDPVNNSDCDIAWFATLCCGKFSKPYYLEEGEVVTRFP